MLRYLLICLACLYVFSGCMAIHVENKESTRCPQARKADRVLRHVVLFAFKDDASPEQVKSVENAFRDLPCKIKAICGFEWGTDVSPEEKADGFTHCFFLTFCSEADRDAYLVHPDHKAFGKTLRPYLKKVLVVDYWTNQ